MPGSTQFPGALDTWPTIGPNTREDDPAAQHDVVHANEMAAIAALQAKVGIDDSADPGSLDARVAGVEDALDSLTTSDVAEGVRRYFTDARAVEAVAAALIEGEHVGISFELVDGAITATVTGGGTGGGGGDAGHQRITPNGLLRVAADGSLRITP